MQDGFSKIKEEPGRRIGLAGSCTAVTRANSLDHVLAKLPALSKETPLSLTLRTTKGPGQLYFPENDSKAEWHAIFARTSVYTTDHQQSTHQMIPCSFR